MLDVVPGIGDQDLFDEVGVVDQEYTAGPEAKGAEVAIPARAVGQEIEPTVDELEEIPI
jgi:hypothetical protein